MFDPYDHPGRRERESIMINNQDKWPMVTKLPLKRAVKDQMEFALLRKNGDQFILSTDEKLIAYVYNTVDQILDDKWHID